MHTVSTSTASPTIVRPDEAAYDEARQAWNLAATCRPAGVAVAKSVDDVVAIVRHAREHRAARGAAGERPRGRRPARPVGRDPAQDRPQPSRPHRCPGPVGPRRRRDGLERGDRGARAARPRRPRRIHPRRRGDRLHTPRRAELARPPVRGRGQPRDGGRAGDRRRYPRPRHGRPGAGPVLGRPRGGGGNFGVVTAIEFDVFPINEVFAGITIWDGGQSTEVLTRWLEWTRTAPRP